MKKYFLLSFVLVYLMCNYGFSQTVTKFAGVAQTTNGTTPLSTTTQVSKDNTLFNQPYSIDVDKNNNFWIADRSNHCIRMIYSSDSKVYIRAGYSQGYKNATGVTAQFDNPMGIAIGPNNEIYVADNGNNCIRKISAFGTIGSAQTVTNLAGSTTSSAGFADGTTSAAQFNGPTDVAYNPVTGCLIVADAANNAIRQVTLSGVVTTIAGGPSMMGNTDGTLTQAKFRLPTGVFVTSTGDIYVADNNNQRIRKISGNNVTTVVTGLDLPSDLVVMPSGDLYITDQHKIVKYAGTSSVYAGSSSNAPGFADGSGTSALFNNLQCIMYRSSDNSLYVADMDNHTIRNITIHTPTPPVCGFTADKTAIYTTESVTFTDQSTNSPSTRTWTFASGTPSTSTSATQAVTYASQGTFNVKLVVSNADGKDSLTKTGYITVTKKVGVNDNSVSSIMLYPSPAKDKVILSAGNINLENASIMIASINGKFTKEINNSSLLGSELTIPVNELQSGMYILIVKTSSDVYKFRFVKE